MDPVNEGEIILDTTQRESDGAQRLAEQSATTRMANAYGGIVTSASDRPRSATEQAEYERFARRNIDRGDAGAVRRNRDLRIADTALSDAQRADLVRRIDLLTRRDETAGLPTASTGTAIARMAAGYGQSAENARKRLRGE